MESLCGTWIRTAESSRLGCPPLFCFHFVSIACGCAHDRTKAPTQAITKSRMGAWAKANTWSKAIILNQDVQEEAHCVGDFWVQGRLARPQNSHWLAYHGYELQDNPRMFDGIWDFLGAYPKQCLRLELHKVLRLDSRTRPRRLAPIHHRRHGEAHQFPKYIPTDTESNSEHVQLGRF